MGKQITTNDLAGKIKAIPAAPIVEPKVKTPPKPAKGKGKKDE